MAESCLRFSGVAKRFGKGPTAITAVQDVNIEVATGEFVALIGPSGCGKSTLLNMASGLDRTSEGEVFVEGEKVNGPNAHVAFMLQKDLLLPWRTIRKNVEFGQEIQHVPAAERTRRAELLLKKYQLGEVMDFYPHQLSGGMRQRAALARTMVMEPRLLLLDEPFSALDAQTKMILQQDLARTLAEGGRTALLITHDLDEAVALADRVLVMSRRPGRITHEIIVELPERANPIARRQMPEITKYTKQLMELLDIGHGLDH